jgi:hypothetical protein
MTAIIAVILALAAQPGDQPSALPSSPAMAAPAASATPSPAIPAANVSWLGATIGQTPAELRSSLGRPNQIVPTNVGDQWSYSADKGNVALEIIVDQNHVVSITARVNPGRKSTLGDPFGGALGMTASALVAARGTPGATYDNGAEVAYADPTGARWNYNFDSGSVSGISVWAPLPPSTAPQVISDATHDGSTPWKAFMVKAASPADAANAELAYLKSLACDTGGTWQIVTEESVVAGGGFFDLYHVACSTTKSPHDFYFDVSSLHGRQ